MYKTTLIVLDWVYLKFEILWSQHKLNTKISKVSSLRSIKNTIKLQYTLVKAWFYCWFLNQLAMTNECVHFVACPICGTAFALSHLASKLWEHKIKPQITPPNKHGSNCNCNNLQQQPQNNCNNQLQQQTVVIVRTQRIITKTRKTHEILDTFHLSVQVIIKLAPPSSRITSWRSCVVSSLCVRLVLWKTVTVTATIANLYV